MGSTKRRHLRFAAFALGLSLGACGAGRGGPAFTRSSPAELCGDSSLDESRFCLPSPRIQRWLEQAPLTITGLREASGGTTDVRQAQVEVRPVDEPGRRYVILAKWKRVPDGGDGFNNNPRKELAAYALQALIFDPADYVVPPTAIRCLPNDALQRFDPGLKASSPDAPCIFGLLAYWLPNVTNDGVLSKERLADPGYARQFANLNLLTYLIEHEDSRTANFMRSTDEQTPRLFSIDNGLSFGSVVMNPIKWWSTDWSKLFFRKLTRESVERMRALTLDDLRAELRVVQELTARGTAVETGPATLPLRPQQGFYMGDPYQFGLSNEEVDNLHKRIRKVLALVDNGAIELL